MMIDKSPHLSPQIVSGRARRSVSAAALALGLSSACTIAPIGSEATVPAATQAGSVVPESGVFTLAPLPYAVDALEAAIDAETMRIHHGRHHKAYVDGLNRAIAAHVELKGLTLEEMMPQMSRLPVAVRNTGGGHWNHRFFWASMAAPGTGGAPSADLLAAIERDFGSLDAMKKAFQDAGASQFGSGWAWLIIGTDGKLAVTSTPNQDNPLMDVASVRGQPILANDVWEHAYYLKYQNRRGDYLAAWWQVVNWNAVSARYAAATRK